MEVQGAARKTGTADREAMHSTHSPPTHGCDDAGMEYLGARARASKTLDKTDNGYASFQDDVLWVVDVAMAERTQARRVSEGIGIGEKCGRGGESFVGCHRAHVEETDRHGVANVGRRFCEERETLGAPPVKLDEKMEVAKS